MRKHPEQVGAGVPQPARLAGEAQQGLHHRQGEHLCIAGTGSDPHGRPQRRPLGVSQQQVIDGHVQCSREGVQIGVHESLQSSMLG